MYPCYVFYTEITVEPNKESVKRRSYEYDPDYVYSSPKKRLPESISYMRIREIVQLWIKHPKWKWSTLKRNGAPEIPNKATAYKWRRQVQQGGNKSQKLEEINNHVSQQLQEARSTFKIIKASHIRNWAVEKFTTLGRSTLNFKCGRGWIDRFKKSHKVSSRKINRLVSKREVRSQKTIHEAAKKFREEIKLLSSNYDPSHIFNTDQCGFSYEITPSRTLTTKGEKIVFGYAQSPTNLSTHSYTVQYIISMSGEILGNVFVCLQEPCGKLGPRVKLDVESYLPSNVTLTCSSSGKLSTSLNEYFLVKQVVPKVSQPFVWIVDSWAGHTNLSSYNKLFGKENDMPEICLKIIPEKCTSLVQPLDTFFHRQLKYLAKEILASLEVLLNIAGVHQEDNWNTRHGVIKLQSLLHFFLSAPIFKEMIKYSWYSSGLTGIKNKFLNVKDVCFTFIDLDNLSCEMLDCHEVRFIKCSHCRKNICINCLWTENHYNFCEKNPFK